MSKVDEEFVFQSIRGALEAAGWRMLAGQAARGTMDLPVVQAREGSIKGSKGALKPDLIASKDGSLLVLELKPSFSGADVEKCDELASSKPLVESLLEGLAARRKWPVDTLGRPVRPQYFLTGVAYQGEVRQLERSVCFALSPSGDRWMTRLPLTPSMSSEMVTSLTI